MAVRLHFIVEGQTEETLVNQTLRPHLARFSISRFIPYIQLHEFEALLLADPQKLDAQVYEHRTWIQRLVRLANGFKSPELIDDGPDPAPSKRIAEEIPAYPRSKVSAGPITAERIGLHTLRTKCQHFDAWLGILESL